MVDLLASASAPALTGSFKTVMKTKREIRSPDSGTDQSDDEAFSPGDQLQLPSPSVSFNSTSMGSSSYGSRHVSVGIISGKVVYFGYSTTPRD
ncbi:hypothetical protein PoB_004109000 [Plakobranchus ocellatus]|uniref:Uncharacterized protein n=1 Tax=Plakobranchus ocellatus TaxID=259542 RepID=A0AAV4B4P8_9GAST|nr:hypothetical protein PoB_004109000 [Plakobranchus ocellatus]